MHKLLGYMMPGQLITIAARPACGKTITGLQIAAHASRSMDVGYFTLEETRKGLWNRLLASYSAVDFERIQLGNDALTAEDRYRIARAAPDLAKLKLRINDRVGYSLNTLRAHLMKAKARKRPYGLIVLDYLQLMRGGSHKEKRDEVSEITRALKLMAEEFQTIIIILSQLNREVEKRPDGRPQLSDLRESGTIEQDSDKVMLLWRPELYMRSPEYAGIFEIITAKNRQGRIGSVQLIWQGAFQRVMSPKALIGNIEARPDAEDPQVVEMPQQRMIGEESVA
jgi:replicative DNA helicase